MSSLALYDLDLDALADTAGTFDATDFEASERFVRKQWLRYADTFGFRPVFDRQLKQRARRSFVSQEGLEAFATWHRAQPQKNRTPELARIRYACMMELRRTHPQRWLTDLLSTDLPERACLNIGDNTGAGPAAPVRETPVMRLLRRGRTQPTAVAPAVQPQHRVFRADVTSSYYHDKDERRADGCVYPVRLSLGTFPYVYGRQLGSRAPGLQWASHGEWQPAVEAMRIASAYWSQLGNMRQDARVVVAQWRKFRQHTARVLDRNLPGSRDPRTGALKGRVTDQTINAPRGLLNTKAYRLVLGNFAAFFAARRAFVQAQLSFIPDTWAAIERNPDPLLRDALEMHSNNRR
ncbi:MAG: hypothetical protein ACPG4T_20490 [Nannocystaceae bacterium]